jgi:hypothetical protein
VLLVLGAVPAAAVIMTTFVLPSELFPVSMRTTGHGISAGIGKLGARSGLLIFFRTGGGACTRARDRVDVAGGPLS